MKIGEVLSVFYFHKNISEKGVYEMAFSAGTSGGTFPKKSNIFKNTQKTGVSHRLLNRGTKNASQLNDRPDKYFPAKYATTSKG